MTPTQALDAILEESEKVIDNEANILFTELQIISSGAMEKTGHFNRSFKIEKIKNTHWRITNSAEYASILANGRRFVDGRFYGTIHWSGGISPMLEKTDNEIERRLSAIRK